MANEKRIVNAEAIARKLKNANCAECNIVRQIQCSACWVNDVLELLDDNSVDAVEVVRCKDCKHWLHMEDGFGDCSNGRFHLKGHADPTMKAEDFCSLGERREGE